MTLLAVYKKFPVLFSLLVSSPIGYDFATFPCRLSVKAGFLSCCEGPS